MKLKLKPLRDQVVVITGASSGIGLTTAEMAAAAGARVVLSSRNENALREAAERIRRKGGEVAYVVADVADPDAVERIATRALERFNGIDTWVNNAGTGIYGKTLDTPLAEKRRVFDVNFWGVVHGCRAAVPILSETGGAIINIGSVAADIAIPLLGIYSASKHAVKGYTDSLRLELERDGAPISVTLVNPSSINTPFIEHARTHLDREPEYAPPVYAPEEVARAVLQAAQKPIREITVGGGGKLLSLMRTLAPRLTDVYQEATQFRQQRSNRPASRSDSLDAPQSGERRHGPTERHTFQRSLYTRAAMSDAWRALPVIAFAGIVAAGVLSFRRFRISNVS